MKYYIPTTTLNFNNILSSESVSPTSFFEKRGFGYTRWFEIPENENNNSILLYDRLLKVERMDSELEDHPMIIEITTDKTFPEVGEGIYLSDKTIYLTPWTTKFIFLTEQHKRIALSLSDSSLETKMIRLYQRGFEVRNAEGTYPTTHKVSDDLNNSEIIHDRVINRLKGFLYGYYIGALLSSDESTVEYYNILKELQNIFAAILSSPHREPTKGQERKVKTLMDSLLFHTPVFKEVESIVGDRAKTIEIVNVLSKYRKPIYNSCPDSFLNELRYGELDDNKALKWVSNELNNLNPITNKNLLSPDKGEIVVLENTLNSIKENIIPDKTENDLFVGLINYILTDDSINGKVSSQRAELTDTLTMKARDLLGNQWETSFIRTFMNQLRKHVRGEEFNQEWNNGVLSSLAAVILKGDDWEVLLDFMKRKGMTDYRLAFAFYGVINGFANLTRDFTDLLLNNDRIYVAGVYRVFHGSLHNESIEINPTVLDRQPVIEQREKLEPEATNEESELDFRNKVLNAFHTIVKKKKNKTTQNKLEEGLNLALEAFGNDSDSFKFVGLLNDYKQFGWEDSSRKPAWRQMCEIICPDYDERMKKPNKQKDESTTSTNKKNVIQRSLDFLWGKEDNNSAEVLQKNDSVEYIENKNIKPSIGNHDINLHKNKLLFVFDNVCWDRIKSLIPNSIHRQFQEDLEWFQSEYIKGDKSQYYAKASRENKATIESFMRYLKKKPYISAINFEELSKYLYMLYD